MKKKYTVFVLLRNRQENKHFYVFRPFLIASLILRNSFSMRKCRSHYERSPRPIVEKKVFFYFLPMEKG